jgi:hypothetical protein
MGANFKRGGQMISSTDPRAISYLPEQELPWRTREVKMIHPIEWKILRRAMVLGIARGVTKPCGTQFVRPWNKHGNRHLSSFYEIALQSVLEQLAPEYAIAEAEFRTVSPRAAKAAATRAANLLKKMTAQLGAHKAQHELTQMKLRRAHENARYGIVPDPAIITEHATVWQRRWFDKIFAFADGIRTRRERAIRDCAANFVGMRSHISYHRDAQKALATSQNLETPSEQSHLLSNEEI